MHGNSCLGERISRLDEIKLRLADLHAGLGGAIEDCLGTRDFGVEIEQVIVNAAGGLETSISFRVACQADRISFLTDHFVVGMNDLVIAVASYAAGQPGGLECGLVRAGFE